jgi:hypothetical protein
MPPQFVSRLTIPVLGLFWMVAVVAGSGALWRHANSPGDAGQPPNVWPAKSSLVRAAHRKTLVMFAHPQCPCTRASIGELAVLMARCGAEIDAYVVFFKPEDAADEWTHTNSFAQATAIPGVTVLLDQSGREAGFFGAATSGQTDLYDADGRLLFSGGITAARGHAGDNLGRAAIGEWASHDQAGRSSTPVFGCALTGTPRPTLHSTP